MSDERHVRLFRNGRSQAVRIPRDFELPGDEAVMRKVDDGTLVLQPARKKSLKRMLERLRALGPLEEDFPEIEDLPPEPFDLDL